MIGSISKRSRGFYVLVLGLCASVLADRSALADVEGGDGFPFEVTSFSNVELLTQDRVSIRADFDAPIPGDEDLVTVSVDGQQIFSEPFGAFDTRRFGNEDVYMNNSLLGLDVTLDFENGELRVYGTLRPKLEEDTLDDGLTITLALAESSGSDTVEVDVFLGVLWSLAQCSLPGAVDGDSCGGGSGVCEAGFCQCCDDLNECTSNVCNPDGSCENPAIVDGTPCDAGQGTCLSGACEPNDLCTNVVCEDLGECVDNVCNPESGECEASPLPDGTSCDGDAGSCESGDCLPIDLCEDAGERCEDDNECTENLCDPETGDCANPALGDGTSCDGGAGSCQLGICQPPSGALEVTRFTNVRLLTQDRVSLRANFDGSKPDDDDVITIALDGQVVFSEPFRTFRTGLLGDDDTYRNDSLLGLDVTLDFGDGELRVGGTVRPKLNEDGLADGLTVTLQMGDAFSASDTVPIEILLGIFWSVFDEDPVPPGTPGPAELPSGDDFSGDLAPNGPFWSIEWPTRVPARSGTLSASLYVPSEDGESFGPGPYPLVVVTPGFGAGHKAYDNYSKHMASWGFAVIGIDFTNAGDHPQSAEDILDTIDWIEQGLSPFGDSVDTSLVATAGHSAGGKVAFGAASIDPDRIGAVIGWDPVNAGGPPCDLLIFGSSDDPDAFCNRDPVAPNPVSGQAGIMDGMVADSLIFASPPGGIFTPEQHAAIHFYDGTVNAESTYVLFPDGRHINWGPTARDDNFEAQVGKPSGMAWLLRHLLAVSGPGIDAYIPPQAEGIEVQSK